MRPTQPPPQRSHAERLELFERWYGLVKWFINDRSQCYSGLPRDEVKQTLRIVLWRCTRTWREGEFQFNTYAVTSFIREINRMRSDRKWHLWRLPGVRIFDFSDVWVKDATASEDDNFGKEDEFPEVLESEHRASLPGLVERLLQCTNLTDRQREAIEVKTKKGLTLRAAAEVMGLVPERVRQLENAALLLLRETAAKFGLYDPF